jgi:hypothetical protein
VCQGKVLSQGIGEALEVLLGVLGVKQFPNNRQQAINLDAMDEAAHGIRGLPVIELGQLHRMQQEAIIDQQAQNQASA